MAGKLILNLISVLKPSDYCIASCQNIQVIIPILYYFFDSVLNLAFIFNLVILVISHYTFDSNDVKTSFVLIDETISSDSGMMCYKFILESILIHFCVCHGVLEIIIITCKYIMFSKGFTSFFWKLHNIERWIVNFSIIYFYWEIDRLSVYSLKLRN